MRTKPKQHNKKLAVPVHPATEPASKASLRAKVRAAFLARAAVCEGCGNAFIPGAGKSGEYCHACSSRHPEEHVCAGCSLPLSAARIARGDIACAKCEDADTRYLPLDRAAWL